MGRSPQALLGVKARAEEELRGQLHGDHGQLLGLGAQLVVVDVWGVGVDDLAHKLEVFLRVLISVVQKSNILLLDAFLDG